ncbi:DUF4239 domain-containing protein [Catenulispora pinisilvae]|uniref:bestrophin-like domain n=1 Tax=Catenulispora pinisilvae TaxID=2705253 RepID=UPI0018914C0E|nr:DUF4239 domain-containing protein [Catenulispora pinisilvae]
MMVFWAILALVVGVIVAVGLARMLGRSERAVSGSHNPQALSVVGSALLSSFILVTAFLIASTWSTYNTDRQHTYDEARSVTTAYWLAGKLQPADRDRVRAGLTMYADQVIADDWPAMGRHQTSDTAAATLDALRVEVGAVKPATAADEQDRADVSAALDDLYSKRLIRAADVNYSMPSLLYLALVIAAVLLVAYPPLVGLTANLRNTVVLSGLGAMVGLGILIVIGLSHPYSEPLSIAPTAFRHALQQFTQING